jgi:antitoxin component of MazEF toxin-antitoxin module
MLLPAGISVMMKFLIKHGNSHALLLDKAVLELLKIDPQKTQLELVTDGNVLIVTPIRNKKKQKELNASLAKIDEKYGSVFRRLAAK